MSERWEVRMKTGGAVLVKIVDGRSSKPEIYVAVSMVPYDLESIATRLNAAQALVDAAEDALDYLEEQRSLYMSATESSKRRAHALAALSSALEPFREKTDAG